MEHRSQGITKNKYSITLVLRCITYLRNELINGDRKEKSGKISCGRYCYKIFLDTHISQLFSYIEKLL